MIDSLIYSLFSDGSYLYAGTKNGGVWRRPLTEMTSSVKGSSIPTNFSLSQNYPNPFNPATTFGFTLDKSSIVSLVVSDELGKEVRILEGKELSAGEHRINWDARDVLSGVYSYRLTVAPVGNTPFASQTRKLLLLK